MHRPMIVLAAVLTIGVVTPARAQQPVADFVDRVAMLDMFVVRSSEMAAERASYTEVDSIAGQMLIDHDSPDEELVDLAEQHDVTLPDQLSQNYQDMLKALAEADDERFDKLYLNFQRIVHADAVEFFRSAAESDMDEDVQRFADRALSNAEEHYQAAQQYLEQLLRDGEDVEGFSWPDASP